MRCGSSGHTAWLKNQDAEVLLPNRSKIRYKFHRKLGLNARGMHTILMQVKFSPLAPVENIEAMMIVDRMRNDYQNCSVL